MEEEEEERGDEQGVRRCELLVQPRDASGARSTVSCNKPYERRHEKSWTTKGDKKDGGATTSAAFGVTTR